ncbi:hypothetical protein [Helicobacter sp. T3_23-1056]
MPQLNPLLESDNIECAHKGKVVLQSSTKDTMCVQDSSGDDAGMISLQDLANATIIGCTNNIAGVPSPCTKLVSIPNSICSTLLEIDNQKIVLAQAISQVLTDKGSPLILQGNPKAKDIFELDEEIADFDNAQNGNENAESISESSAKSNESNAESNPKSNTDSSDSQPKQDSQKEIIEMCFSYGEECERIKTDSKIESNVNLHIVTQGYKLGESIEITLESDDGRIINAGGNVNENGEVVIYNVFTKNKE